MIELNGVSYSYPNGRKVLEDIDIRIEKGSFTIILGGNGSGKSTLIRHMNGLLKPSQGVVSVCGMDTTSPTDIWKIRQKVGMVFQDPHSQAVGATIEEDVAFGPENLALESDEIRLRVTSAIANVGLEGLEGSLLMYLSGGQLQKTAIAGTLAMAPNILIFDEVTSMLDSDSRSQIIDIVRQLNKRGNTVIYVTHHMEEALFADRVIVLENGSIASDGTPRDVFREIYASGRRVPPHLELAFRLQYEGIISPDVFPLDALSLKEEICRSK
jgi:energy-coupling factor transport system ATP-binding protein